MRVLVANIPLPTNRYLVDLNSALSELCVLNHSSDEFWNMRGEYDVVHLHFPEYLTYEIQDAYINGLTDDLIRAVAERLAYWSARATIIVTRHNVLPHAASNDPRWAAMYETVYSHADGVVHLANASIAEFEKRYADTHFKRGKRPTHTVVPIQNYCSLPNDIGATEARRRLGIAEDASVMLVFGAIRHDAERDLILKTFSNLTVARKVLLVSKWRETLPDVSWVRLKYWLRDLKRLYYRLRPQYHLNYDFVTEDDTQLYLNAADVLFIPRLQALNSANLPLGMTFGKVVVGPDTLNVGELLRDTGNPAFDPARPDTAAAAVEQGFVLAQDGHTGANNRKIALSRWDVNECAARYLVFFRDISDRVSTSTQATIPITAARN